MIQRKNEATEEIVNFVEQILSIKGTLIVICDRLTKLEKRVNGMTTKRPLLTKARLSDYPEELGGKE